MKINQDKTTNSRKDFFYYAFRNILLVSAPLLLVSTLALSLPHSSATVPSSTDSLSLTLSTSCTINSILIEPHSISMGGGQYEDNIGNTRVNAYCNDGNGYSIYAIGSSGDTDGNTDLINSADSHYNIHTGIYDSNSITSSTPSSWSMKLIAGSGSGSDLTPPTIMNSYDNYNTVPSDYTLVASRTSGTNMTIDTDVTGSYFTTTYDIYATSVQPAGTYEGKVKYIMVHPNSNNHSVITDLNAAFAASGKQPAYQDENGYYYAMQDMSNDICNLVIRTGEATSAQLVDIRDNKLYWIAKLKDDNCWMTQNLDLDIGGTGVLALTSENTDISADPNVSGAGIYSAGYASNNDIYTWTPADTAITSGRTIDYSDNSVNGWNSNLINPYSAEAGDTYYYTSGTTENDIRYTSLSQCIAANHTGNECAHYHAGNYYNWPAAVASNNTSGFNTRYNNALNSICPKNWRLPIAINSENSIIEFGNLLKSEGVISDVTSNPYAANGLNIIRANPLFFLRSGSISGNSLYDSAKDGSYWSSTVHGDRGSYFLNIANYGASPVGNNGTQSNDKGRSVRCLAR